MTERIFRILKEPIVLFFLFGGLIFLLYTAATSLAVQKEKQIVVSIEQVEMLQASFAKTWQRPPDQKELDGLIQSYIQDEVFYREAVAMGLDKSDRAVKRRLRQTMELILDDYTTVYPTEAQLQAYLSANTGKFTVDPRISFRHQYFGMEEKEKAISQLSSLRGGKVGNDVPMAGLNLLPDHFEDETHQKVSGTFGNEFANSLFEVEVGSWRGPIKSAYGWHLVLVSELAPGIVPPLNDIWDIVEREWSLERKTKLKDEQYARMKARYEISVQMPEDADDQP
jgi:hypothetical protein